MSPLLNVSPLKYGHKPIYFFSSFTQKVVSKCTTCSSNITPNSPLHKTFGNIQQNNRLSDNLGPLDPLNIANQRIRELELELAQTKLAQVEAECKNQDLNHQLSTTLTEMQTNRGSWQPWLSKTLNSIQEKVQTKRDIPSFQSYIPNESGGSGGPAVRMREHHSPTMKNKLTQRNSMTRNSFDWQGSANSVGLSGDQQILKDSLSFETLK